MAKDKYDWILKEYEDFSSGDYVKVHKKHGKAVKGWIRDFFKIADVMSACIVLDDGTSQVIVYPVELIEHTIKKEKKKKENE